MKRREGSCQLAPDMHWEASMAKLRGGLIQMSLKGDTSMKPERIRDLMLEAHMPLVAEAGKRGVQVLCFQEVTLGALGRRVTSGVGHVCSGAKLSMDTCLTGLVSLAKK